MTSVPSNYYGYIGCCAPDRKNRWKCRYFLIMCHTNPGTYRCIGIHILSSINLDAISNLIRDTRGCAEFSVQGKLEKISVIYGAKYTVAVVYAPRNREFICFEPMAALTNGFNLAHTGVYKELQVISPQKTWCESFWISSSGF